MDDGPQCVADHTRWVSTHRALASSNAGPPSGGEAKIDQAAGSGHLAAAVSQLRMASLRDNWPQPWFSSWIWIDVKINVPSGIAGNCGYGLGTDRGISPSAALPYYPSAFDSLTLAHAEDVTTSVFRLEGVARDDQVRVLPLALNE